MNPQSFTKAKQGVRITDERRLLSRQRRWQLRQLARGLCPQCGRRTGGKVKCVECRRVQNEAQRRRRQQKNNN